MPNPKLYKSIFEVRYQAHLKFYNLMMPAAEKFEQFPDWETNRLAVVLMNRDKRASLFISHDRFTYDQDSGDEELEEENLGDILNKLTPALEVSKFLRLGYRRLYILPLNIPFESLVTILDSKLFSQETKLKDILPNKTVDLMYRVDSYDDKFKYHLTIGPTRKKEIPLYISFNKRYHLNPLTAEDDFNELTQSYPEVGLFFDIDIFKEGFKEEERITVEEASDFLTQANLKAKQLTEELSKFLFETKVKG